MKYIRPIIMFLVCLGMLVDAVMETYTFVGIGAGLLLILSSEEFSMQYKKQLKGQNGKDN